MNMSDLSVRNTNDSMQRMTDAVLRAGGGSAAVLLIAPSPGDATDAGQLGLDAPNFQGLTLAPAIFRRTRPTMTQNQPATYELLISATAVAQQVSLLQLSSADALFSMVAAVNMGGLTLLIEEWACTVSLGTPMAYRLLLRASEPQSMTTDD